MNERTQALLVARTELDEMLSASRGPVGFDFTSILSLVIELLPLFESGVTPAALIRIAVRMLGMFIDDSELLAKVEQIVTLLMEIFA